MIALLRADVRPLAWALAQMHPDLTVPDLPGETAEEARARREAALDILGDLLAEYALEPVKAAEAAEAALQGVAA